MARRASVTKPLSVIMAPRRSSRKVRVERFGTAWARRVSQAQRRVGIGVSMGPQPKDVEHPSIARLACKARPRSGRAVTLKWQRATKNLTPEGVDKAAETLNSSLRGLSHTCPLLTKPHGGWTSAESVWARQGNAPRISRSEPAATFKKTGLPPGL